MNDTISRQAAIDAVIDADYKDCGVLVERRCRKFEEALRSLPAAQPEIVRCRACRWSPWRSRMYADSAVEIKVCSHSRSPEGFCAWGKEAKKCGD